MKVEKEHIEYHFFLNSDWEKYFLSKYPNWSVDTWGSDVEKLFIDNGYTFELVRMSENPESKFYNCLKYIDLIDKNGEFVVGRGPLRIEDAVEQLLIQVIADHDVDFKLFK